MRRRVDSPGLPEPSEVILARDALVEALDALRDGSRDVRPLESALGRYRQVAGTMLEGDLVWAFVGLVEALAQAVRWTSAVWDADEDAARYATAARLRARQVQPHLDAGWPSELRQAAQDLGALENFEVPPRVAACLSAVPLPARLTGLYRPSDEDRPFETEPAPASSPTVAILIREQGEPVMRPAVVRPGALHQFEIEARVNEWPDEADELEIAFLSVHPRDFLYVSGARFTRNELRQPLEIRVAGERPADNPPLEVTAKAAFLVGGESHLARLAGNTTLEVVTFDPGTALPLNMATAADRLQRMMSELSNALPHLETGIRRDTRLLLEATMRFSHTMLDDRLGQHDDVNEAWFQRELQQFLQADPQIGARLDTHATRAGGETDLGLGDVVLELKVEKSSAISLDEARDRYASQATQYASAGDCQVSLLAVLDVSSKRAPAGVMGNEMGWAYPTTTGGASPPFPSLVGVVVVRAGFPRPSDFSRRPSKTVT